MKIDILGEEWELMQADSGKEPYLEDCDGYCDHTLKKCIIKKIVPTGGTVGDVDTSMKQTARHEIIHAFLFESGLGADSWASNEEVVDWIARQFPKLLKVFMKIGAL